MVLAIWSLTEFFVIMDCLLPFHAPMDPENENFEKMKKALEDIIVLQMFTINDSHDIWFFRYRVQQTNFFCHFGPFFALLPPSNNPKIKFLKN